MRTIYTTLLVCVISFVLSTAAAAQTSLPPGFYVTTEYVSRCGVLDAGLICEIDYTDWQPDEPEPDDCEFDRIKYVTMDKTGSVKNGWLCVSDTWMHEGIKELNYSQNWKSQEFSCDLTEKRLRCTNAEKHGWELSRKDVKLF